jgi:hypothetical protein
VKCTVLPSPSGSTAQAPVKATKSPSSCSNAMRRARESTTSRSVQASTPLRKLTSQADSTTPSAASVTTTSRTVSV